MTAAIPSSTVSAVKALPSTITQGQGGELADTKTVYDALKVTVDVVNALAALGGGSGGGTGGTSLPDVAFATRLASAATKPVPVIYAGSSTVEGQKAATKSQRFVDRMQVGLQLSYPSGRPSSDARSLETQVQDSIGGVSFTAVTAPGVHGYNAGQGGTKASNFLLDANIPALAALNPAAWVIQVGSNDAVDAVTPAQYQANLQAKINTIKANMPAGSVYAIYLIHQYLRPSLRSPTYPWAQYMAALQAIADGDPTVVRAVDLSGSLPGVPGPDNASALATGYIDADLIHMTSAGHAVWAGAVYAALTGKPLPAGTVNYTGPAGLTGSDAFSGGASTGVPGWTSSSGGWVVTSDGKASLGSGSSGVLTRDPGLVNGQLTADVIYPASGFIGLRARAVGATEAVTFYIDRAAGTYNLSTITNGTNASLVTGVPVPGAIAVAGTAFTMGFTFVDDTLTGYINGTAVITATLTAQQMSVYNGTAIGLRQTAAGAANGTFDNVAWSNIVTLGTSGGGGTAPDPGSGTVVATDTFAGTAGSAWNAQWVSNYGSGPAATINGSGKGNLTTPATAYGMARTQYLAGPAAAADEEVRLDWVFPDVTEQYFRVALRSPGTLDTNSGNLLSCYELSLNASGTSIALNRRATGGGATNIGSMPWTYTAGQVISIRFQTVGGTIQFRAWVGGTTEPTTWSVSVTDYTFGAAGKLMIKYSNGAAATAKTGLLSNVALSLPGTAGTGGGSQFTATANTPIPANSNIPGWDIVVWNDFLTDVAAGSSGFRAAYPTMTTYDGFGDTAWAAIVRRDKIAGGPGTPDPSRSAWYSDKTLSVANSQLICRVGWDTALQKNLCSFILPRRYAGQIMGRVDFLLRSDVILGYKIVPLWWSAANPDVWTDGEIDYPESEHLGTTFKGYIHDTLGTPINNVRAYEPIRFPGVTTAPRLDSWHVFSQQWTETEISFWLDGVKVTSYTKPTNGNGFPTNPMRFGFQIEARDLEGRTLIDQAQIGNVQLGWVVQYTRNAATAA